MQDIGDLRRAQVRPVGENGDGPLPKTEPLHGREDLGPDLWQLSWWGKRDPALTGEAAGRSPVLFGGLVDHAAEQVGAPIGQWRLPRSVGQNLPMTPTG